MGMCGMCAGVRWCARVCAAVVGCGRVCAGVRGYAQVSACVWDEFLEFLPENRVPTSADFNMYPIRIFVLFLLLTRAY